MHKLLRLDSILVVVVVLLIVGFILYSPALGAGFVHLDDVDGVVNNPAVKDICEALKVGHVKTIADSLIYSIFGLNPAPYHAVSILLHILNSILVYVLAKQILNKKAAILAPFIFLIHPANSEAVAWVSGSVYLYQALCWLLILVFFTQFRKTGKILYLVPSLFFYVLYFMFVGRVWGLIIPFVLVGFDIFILKQKYDLKKLVPILAFFMIALFYLFSGFKEDYSKRAQDLEYYYVGLGAESRVVSVLRAVDRSFRLFLVPYKLDISLGEPNRTAIGYLGVVVSLIILSYFLKLLYKKDKKLFGFGVLVYLAALPIFNPVSIGLGYAERYFYFSSVFFAFLLSSLLFLLKDYKKYTKWFFPALIMIVFLFSLRTFIRTFDWKNDETLWRASLYANEKNNYKAYNEIGNVYYRDGNLREALVYYEKALKIRPLYPEVLHNVGLTFLRSGQLENAKIYFQKSLQVNPNMYESYYRLGQLHGYEGDSQKAKELYMYTLQLKSNFSPAVEELNKLE